MKQDSFPNGLESLTYFGNCPASVSEAPSSAPTDDGCAGNKDRFKILMSPDPSAVNDLYFKLKKKSGSSYNTIFSKMTYHNATPNQESTKCIWNKICVVVEVYSKSGNASIDTSRFFAHFDGKYENENMAIVTT